MCSTASYGLLLAQEVNIHIVTTTPNCVTNAPTLVFLHYWGGSSKTWRSVTRLLSNDYATVAIDLRGWGQSMGPDQKEGYTVSLMASDVEAVISYLRLADYIIVGLSMGAKIAQLVGAHQPQGLRALVLASPAPPSPLRLDPSMREQQIHAYDNQVLASAVTENILTASELAPEILSELVEDQLRGNVWARKAWPDYGMSENILDQIQMITVPIIILAAERDLVEPVKTVRKLVYEKLPTSEMKIIKGSGHLSPVESPELVANEIRDFIQER